jgi:hypothetical protein
MIYLTVQWRQTVLSRHSQTLAHLAEKIYPLAVLICAWEYARCNLQV